MILNCYRCGKQPCECKDGITLYCADCRAVLPKLSAGCVDLVLTSPPYNLGNNHHRGNVRHKPYCDSLPECQYQTSQREVLTELFRVAESVFYNHKNRIIDGEEISPREWIRQTPWTCRQTLVWVNGGPNHDPIRFYPKTERIFWLAKDSTRWLDNHKHWDVLTFYPDHVCLTGGGHTRTFPLELARAIIGLADWASVVLDPFAGSGTALRAAKDLGRRAIGIEIEEKYCEIAANRLRQEVLF